MGAPAPGLLLKACPMDQFGDQGLVAHPELLGFLFDAIEIRPIDANAQDRVFFAALESFSDLFKFLLGYRNIFIDLTLNFLFLFTQADLLPVHMSPLLYFFVIFRVGYAVFKNMPFSSITNGTA